METMTVGTVVFSVEDTARCTRDGRPVYQWSCKDTVSCVTWGDSDLKGPACGREPSEREMLGTLFSFLSAALESRSYRERTGRAGDNEDLFPPAMLDACSGLSDEIGMRAVEIEESEDQ